MGKIYIQCQSCGMPLRDDKNWGWTEMEILVKCIVALVMKMVNLKILVWP